MAIKTLLFVLGFIFVSGGALVSPMLGVIGYVLHYSVWPENQWWGKEISHWGIRYAFTIGLCLLIGTAINKHRLKVHPPFMRGHEWLLVGFWLTAMLGTLLAGEVAYHPHDKLDQQLLLDKITKVVIFCLLLSHIVTTVKRFDLLLWTLVIGTLYTGYQAWEAPLWRFTQGRLNGIGGPDFRESSYLGAHFAMMLPLIGVQFLRCGWKAKIICLMAGGFAVNGLILTRTRAAALAVAVGVICALLFALRGKRRRIFVYLLPGLIVAGYLTDAGFRDRMKTIQTNPNPDDTSATGRLEIWSAARNMFWDHPMGVGVGGFRVVIARYSPEHPRRDAHNTYLRCATELGIPGIGLMITMIISGGLCLARARRLAWLCPDHLRIRYYVYGLGVSLAVMLTAGIFMTQLYIEEFWWMLMLPICLLRAAEYEYATSREAVVDEAELTEPLDGYAGPEVLPGSPEFA